MGMDFPRVRASSVCPLCGAEKEAGLVVCWACYREHDMRYGNPEAESAIRAAEDRLDLSAGGV
jgi:NMD protein affecting ribosome stability and mRNA decay